MGTQLSSLFLFYIIIFIASTFASEHGESCELENPCNSDKFLTCSNENVCECNLTISLTDEEKGSCIALVNSTCQTTDDCVPNAFCSSDTQLCNCKYEFSQTLNGTCLATHSQQCSNHWSTACNSEQGLICNQGNCTCKYQDFQTFDKILGKCRSKVLGPCENGSIPCVENAHCSSSTAEGEYSDECECDSGYSEVDGYCQLSVGQPCNYTFNQERPHDRWNRREQVEKPAGPVCDTLVPLKCIDGTCQCPPLKYYDRQSKSCKGLVGSLCDMYGSSGSTCVHGAVCTKRKRSNDSHSSKGICACKSEWTVSKDKRCI